MKRPTGVAVARITICRMSLSIARVVLPDDFERLVDFLCANRWPFHRITQPQTADVAQMEFANSEVTSYWAGSDGRDVGLIRLLDLDDLVEGSPLFDVRIAEADRGRGVGAECVQWLTKFLFTTYPGLHRVEANTRADNVAMQSTLRRSGYQLEGRLRESWRSEDGRRYDTLVYGLLRTEQSRSRQTRWATKTNPSPITPMDLWTIRSLGRQQKVAAPCQAEAPIY